MWLEHLVEEAKDLATSVSSAGLLVVHDAVGGGEDEVAELTRGENVRDPLVELGELDIEAGGHDTALVESADEGDDDDGNYDSVHSSTLLNRTGSRSRRRTSPSAPTPQSVRSPSATRPTTGLCNGRFRITPR